MVFIFTGALSWLAHYGFFSLLIPRHEPSPAALASIIMIIMSIHEIGHLTAMSINGIKSHIIFFVIGGVTKNHPDYELSLKTLPGSRKALIMLGGVMANLAIIPPIILLYFGGFIREILFYFILFSHGIIISGNLLPLGGSIGAFDGKVFLNTIFEGTTPKEALKSFIFLAAEVVVVFILLIGSLAAYNVLNFYLLAGIGLIGCFFIKSIYAASRSARFPKAVVNFSKMKNSERYLWSVVYILLFGTGIFILCASFFI